MSNSIPSIWKKSIIAPIPKVVNSPNAIEHRPISLLCPISKIFEKIIFTKLTEFLEQKQIIPSYQHGFQRKKSVILSLGHENNHTTDILYFDLSKAFDSVPISRLIAKLSSFGVQGPLLQLISCYLSNRSYTVRVGQFYSQEKSVPSGVPQGSVGGPILFVAYISDLTKLCKVEGVKIKLFADDLKPYSTNKTPDDIHKPLQEFIVKFTDYCNTNGLSINPKKCNVLYIGNKNKQLSYTLLDSTIKTVEQNQPVRDLGLYFTSDLKWEKHNEIILKKARRISFAILKSIKYSNIPILSNLFKVYVRPILDFATNVFNPYLVKDINKLEKIQKDFLRIIYKRSNRKLFEENPLTQLPSYQELLFLTNLESLELRRLKSDLILFRKYLHGHTKIECFKSYTCRETITRGEKYKITPNICKTIIRHNSFFVRTSRIYSKLDSNIRNCDPKLFKLKIDTYPSLNKFCKCKI